MSQPQVPQPTLPEPPVTQQPVPEPPVAQPPVAQQPVPEPATDRAPKHRPPFRRSTALLVAVFLLALVTYILVRPAPPSAHAAPAVPTSSSGVTTAIAA